MIVTDPGGEPVFVLDSHHFLRDALFNQLESDPSTYWHRPIIVRDMRTKLGDVIGRMKVTPERPDDDVIDHDMILVWSSRGLSAPAERGGRGRIGIWRSSRRRGLKPGPSGPPGASGCLH